MTFWSFSDFQRFSFPRESGCCRAELGALSFFPPMWWDQAFMGGSASWVSQYTRGKKSQPEDLSPFILPLVLTFSGSKINQVSSDTGMSLHLRRIFSIFSCDSERPNFKDYPVLPAFILPPRWETAAWFKSKCTQFQLPGIEHCLQHGNFQPNSSLCVTSHPSAVCSFVAAVFELLEFLPIAWWVSLSYWPVKWLTL